MASRKQIPTHADAILKHLEGTPSEDDNSEFEGYIEDEISPLAAALCLLMMQTLQSLLLLHPQVIIHPPKQLLQQK